MDDRAAVAWERLQMFLTTFQKRHEAYLGTGDAERDQGSRALGGTIRSLVCAEIRIALNVTIVEGRDRDSGTRRVSTELPSVCIEERSRSWNQRTTAKPAARPGSDTSDKSSLARMPS